MISSHLLSINILGIAVKHHILVSYLRSHIAEHKGRSARTGSRIFNCSFSAIRDHAMLHDHLIKDRSFEIRKSTTDEDQHTGVDVHTYGETYFGGTGAKHFSTVSKVCMGL